MMHGAAAVHEQVLSRSSQTTAFAVCFEATMNAQSVCRRPAGLPVASLYTACLVLIAASCMGSVSGLRGPTLARQLQAASCNENCSPGACTWNAADMYFCKECMNGFEINHSGVCVCPAGTYPQPGSPVSCQTCPRGSWCPGGTHTAGTGIRACGTGSNGSMTTFATGSKSIQDCVNSPGYYFVSPRLAIICPASTYSRGYKNQRACTPCPGGYATNPLSSELKTSSESCKTAPGYFLASAGVTRPCPQGTYKAGYATAMSCTPCAANVTTNGVAKTSVAACAYLLPGYEQGTTGSLGEVTAARICRQNNFCPGGSAPGFFACPDGRWTKAPGAKSQYECLIPPGHYLQGGNVTKCASGLNGGYRAGWSTTATSCNSCGSGVYVGTDTNLTIYDADGYESYTLAVATKLSSCYVEPGMELVYSAMSGSYTFIGRTCNVTVLGAPAHLNYTQFGSSTRTVGGSVKPCLWCNGTATNPGPTGGYTGCIPAPSL